MDVLDRQRKLQERMRQQGIGGFLVTQNVDLYYFTGSMQGGYLFIPSEGNARFYVRRSVERAAVESTSPVEPLGSFRQFGERLRRDFPAVFDTGSVTLATEYDVLPVQQFERLRSLFPAEVRWTDGSALVRELRMRKSPQELARIREAARIVDLAFEQAVAQIHEGMTDLELIVQIEQTLRRHGHMGIMRMRGYNQEIITGMVASGEAAAVPTYFEGPAGGQGLGAASPQGAGRKPIARNEPILIDIGCCIEGYTIDQTRTVVIGDLPDDLADAYAVAENILRMTERAMRPGASCEQLYFDARAAAAAAGLENHFMGYGDNQVRFLGHGIGLEIDEWPVLARGFDMPLEPGMVIAVEPKFTFPGRGVVGIENSYVITEDGWERLTLSREGIIRLA
jgi:Xaa-Pro aminopeptidase